MPNTLDLQYGIKPVNSTALENSHILVTPSTFGYGGPFVMIALTAINFDTTTGYIINIYDSTTVPGDGAVTPVYSAFVAVATATVPQFVSISWVQTPIKCASGIVVVGSSTLTTPFTQALATNSKLAFFSQVAA